MNVKLTGQFASIEVKIKGSLILANRELTKAIIDHLKDTLVDLEKELAKTSTNGKL